jgi:hypothetical protein
MEEDCRYSLSDFNKQVNDGTLELEDISSEIQSRGQDEFDG